MKALRLFWPPDWPPECTGQRIIVTRPPSETPVLDNDGLSATQADWPLDFTAGDYVAEIKGFNELDYYEQVKHLPFTVPEDVSGMGTGGLEVEEVDI